MTRWVLSTVGKSLEGWVTRHGLCAAGAGDDEMQSAMRTCLSDYLQQLVDNDPNATSPCGDLQPLVFKFRKWEASYKDQPEQPERNIHLAFFATPESAPSACAQIDVLNESVGGVLREIYPHLHFEQINSTTGRDLLVNPIDSKSKSAFMEGIGTLTDNILRYLGARPAPGDELFLNPTGGFKGLWVVWPLISLRYPRVQFLYSQENSQDVFELPQFPLALDFGTFEELHSVLLQPDGVSRRFLSVVPKQVGDLFDQEHVQTDACLPNAFGRVISQVYDRRARALSGSGSMLLERIQSPKLQRIITERVPYWQNVWLGDQIPETAEHSKGHSLRLMEFAVQAMSEYPGIIDKMGGNAGLYLLFATIWLHDIGHSAITYSVSHGDNQCVDIPIDRFPSLVRDWHAYSSRWLLDSQEYLPSVRDGHDLVALIARYHRRLMPLRPLSNPEIRIRLPKHRGILTEEVFSLQTEATQTLDRNREGLLPELQGLSVENLLAIEAVLRFLDASDVQAARVSNPEYIRARQKRTHVEVEVLARRLSSLLESVPDDVVRATCETVLESASGWRDALQEEVSAGNLKMIGQELGKLEDKVLELVAEAVDPDHRPVVVVDRESRSQSLTSEDWHVILEALSLADRIVFKTVQDVHFRKHASIACCWYRSGANGLRVYMEPEKAGDELPKHVAWDIYGEAAAMGSDFTDVVPFEGVFNALDDTKYDEKVPGN